MPQDNYPNYRQSTPTRVRPAPPPPPPADDAIPHYGQGTFNISKVPPPPPKVSPFANMPVPKYDTHSNDMTPVVTPTVTPKGTPRSDATNKIFSAARHGKTKIVEEILMMEEGYFDPLNTVDHHGNTLFHIACQNGHKKVAKLAIKFGGDMNAQNGKGNTGLHFLYQFGYVEHADYFIGKGADPTITNHKGYECRQGIKGDAA